MLKIKKTLILNTLIAILALTPLCALGETDERILDLKNYLQHKDTEDLSHLALVDLTQIALRSENINEAKDIMREAATILASREKCSLSHFLFNDLINTKTRRSNSLKINHDLLFELIDILIENDSSWPKDLNYTDLDTIVLNKYLDQFLAHYSPSEIFKAIEPYDNTKHSDVQKLRSNLKTQLVKKGAQISNAKTYTYEAIENLIVSSRLVHTEYLEDLFTQIFNPKNTIYYDAKDNINEIPSAHLIEITNAAIANNNIPSENKDLFFQAIYEILIESEHNLANTSKLIELLVQYKQLNPEFLSNFNHSIYEYRSYYRKLKLEYIKTIKPFYSIFLNPVQLLDLFHARINEEEKNLLETYFAHWIKIELDSGANIETYIPAINKYSNLANELLEIAPHYIENIDYIIAARKSIISDTNTEAFLAKLIENLDMEDLRKLIFEKQYPVDHTFLNNRPAQFHKDFGIINSLRILFNNYPYKNQDTIIEQFKSLIELDDEALIPAAYQKEIDAKKRNSNHPCSIRDGRYECPEDIDRIIFPTHYMLQQLHDTITQEYGNEVLKDWIKNPPSTYQNLPDEKQLELVKYLYSEHPELFELVVYSLPYSEILTNKPDELIDILGPNKYLEDLIRYCTIHFLEDEERTDYLNLIEQAQSRGANISGRNLLQYFHKINDLEVLHYLRDRGAICNLNDNNFDELWENGLNRVLLDDKFVIDQKYRNLNAPEQEHAKIPYTIHHIWLTHQDSPREIRPQDIQNAIKTKNIFNQGREPWTHIVWTNAIDLIPESIQQLQEVGIEVRSIQDYQDQLQAYNLVEDLIEQKDWGKASDLLRVALVLEFGGVYADINFIFNRDLTSEAHRYDYFTMTYGHLYVDNYFFGARPHHPITSKYLQLIARNLTNPPEYLKKIAEEDPESRTLTDMGTANPSFIAYYLEANKDGNIDVVYPMIHGNERREGSSYSQPYRPSEEELRLNNEKLELCGLSAYNTLGTISEQEICASDELDVGYDNPDGLTWLEK